MTSVLTERLYTCDEFDALPGPDDGRKMELVDGRVVYSMTVSHDHGELQVEIAARLRAFVRRWNLGRVSTETGFRLREAPPLRGRVRAPDVAFIAAERDPGREARQRGSLHLAPDLAVEIRSPDDTERAITEKVGQYLEAGVVRIWVVDPATRTVAVHRPEAAPRTCSGEDTLTSEDAGFAAEGFVLPLVDLFAVLE